MAGSSGVVGVSGSPFDIFLKFLVLLLFLSRVPGFPDTVGGLGLVGGFGAVGVSGFPSGFFLQFLVLLLFLFLIFWFFSWISWFFSRFLPKVPASPPVSLLDCLVLLLI